MQEIWQKYAACVFLRVRGQGTRRVLLKAGPILPPNAHPALHARAGNAGHERGAAAQNPGK